jgi:signal transduction histidine kinase
VLEGEVDERLHLQLRAVASDVQQIDDLISDMLDYARLDHPACAWTSCRSNSALAA